MSSSLGFQLPCFVCDPFILSINLVDAILQYINNIEIMPFDPTYPDFRLPGSHCLVLHHVMGRRIRSILKPVSELPKDPIGDFEEPWLNQKTKTN